MTAPRAVDQPEAGFFILRLVAGAWRVPARIWQDDAGIWRAEIDGELQEPGAADWAKASGIERVWLYGERVHETEYHHRNRIREWVMRHDRNHPAANPKIPISLRAMPAVF